MKITRRGFFGVLAGIAAAVGGPTVWMTRMKTYDGPPSDHFDGTYFFDKDGSPPKQFSDVLRWQFTRKPEKWPERAPNRIPADALHIHLSIAGAGRMAHIEGPSRWDDILKEAHV